MSGELIRLDLDGTKPRFDTASNIQREPATFNKYINPGEDAVWNEYLYRIHRLSPTHPRIVEDGWGSIYGSCPIQRH